jgi:ribosomal protein S18 acetylase RimI-like enzyme
MRARAPVSAVRDLWAVRPAHSLDVPWMRDIWRAMMAQHDQTDPAFTLAENASALWEDGLHDLIARCDSFALVVPQQGFCCGWVTRPPPIYAAEQVGHLSEICVAHAHRGRGVGTALMPGLLSVIWQRTNWPRRCLIPPPTCSLRLAAGGPSPRAIRLK